MAIEVMIFGQLAEITGTDKLSLPLAADKAELVKLLHKQFPNLAQANYKLAVNKVVKEGHVNLQEGDVIALLPPFSGG